MVIIGLAFHGAAHAADQNGTSSASGGGTFAKDAEGWWVISRGSGGVNGPGGGVRRLAVPDFWPAAVVASPLGFVTTRDGIPVRVFASSYQTPLFDTPATPFPGGVVDVMKPFRAYYVLRKQNASLLVAEPPFTPQSATFWARQSDCYVWATGKVAEVKGTPSLYATEEQARAGTPPLTPTAKYVDFPHLSKISGVGAPPPMSRLPVLLQKGNLAQLLCPAYAGELCWMNAALAGDSLLVLSSQ